MPVHAVAHRAEYPRDRRWLGHFRHVARLTALSVVELAVQPLLIRHLLRQAADRLPVRPQRLRQKRVTRGAELRLADMRGLRRPISFGGTEHDAPMTGLQFERPVLGSRIGPGGRLHDEAAVVALARSEALGADLMAHGARDAVGRLTPFLFVGRERQMREHAPLFAAQLRLVPRNRHMADRALVLDRRRCARVVHRLAADTRLPVRVARGIGHDARAPVEADRHVVARCGEQSVVARDAPIRRVEFRLDGLRIGGGDDNTNERDERERNETPDHRHPSNKLPSNQSHSR